MSSTAARRRDAVDAAAMHDARSAFDDVRRVGVARAPRQVDRLLERGDRRRARSRGSPSAHRGRPRPCRARWSASLPTSRVADVRGVGVPAVGAVSTSTVDGGRGSARVGERDVRGRGRCRHRRRRRTARARALRSAVRAERRPTAMSAGRAVVTAPDPREPFLDDADGERAVGGEDRAAGQTAAAAASRSPAGRRAATRRPGTAGGTTSRGRGSPSAAPGAVPRQTERQQGRVEQGHVARVGDDARVQRRVVGQRAVGPQPDLLARDRVALCG